MARDFPCVSSWLLQASILTTLGAAVAACSGNAEEPTPTPGADAAIDQGTPDTVGADGCQPMTYYGPMPCTDDAQCIAANGPGYRCAKEYGFNDPCGGFVSWPTCLPSVDAGAPDVKDECQPMAYYGPMQCSSDEECETQYGPGYRCDKSAGFNDPCNGFVSWPNCVPSIDAGAPDVTTDEPMVYYGPVVVEAGSD